MEGNRLITEADIAAMECGPMGQTDQGREFLAGVRLLLIRQVKLEKIVENMYEFIRELENEHRREEWS